MTRKAATEDGDNEMENMARKAMDEERYDFAINILELGWWEEDKKEDQNEKN